MKGYDYGSADRLFIFGRYGSKISAPLFGRSAEKC